MSADFRPRLAAPYDREIWTTILRDLFPNGTVTLLEAPAEIEAPHDSVHATRQLGHLQLADGRVALIEVEAADTVRLARNRIALRNFIGRLIKKHAHETWPDLKDDTLRQYLSEAAGRGFLMDAGRGRYSSLLKPAILPAEPVQKWIDLVASEFPLLDFTCWARVR